jgi:gamma-glutamyltranspeptidase / glutathione hydrolase
VAAESPLAAQAGVRILERGGNAVDAAIATNAMMGVVEPMMNGIGGDLFAIVYDAKANKLYGINASGWAPKGLTIEYLQKLGVRSMPQQGVHAITVPGAVDGWQKLADKFGRKKLAEDLAAAIRTAQDGFPVRNGRRRTGQHKWIICEQMRKPRGLFSRKTARRKSGNCSRIPIWHGP